MIAWFLAMALLTSSISLPASAQEITTLEEPPAEETQVQEEHSGTILSWEWEGGSLTENKLTLVTPDPENPLTWEEVVRQLPQSIRATLQPEEDLELVPGASEEALALESREIPLAGWSSSDGALGEGSVLPASGTITLEAALPEGYRLAPEAPQLQVMVELDSPAPATEGQVETTYLDANGEQQTVMATPVTVPEGKYSVTLKDGWYVVNSTIDTYASFVINGKVNLILADGCTLDTKNGVQVSSFWNGNLTIYGQSTDEGTMGKLIAKNTSGYSAIGGTTSDTGVITINGGHIVASTSGRTSGAAIGGAKGRSGGTITINGGIVEATASGESGITSGSAAIGGGSNTSGGTIEITGGTVTATAGHTNFSDIGNGSNAAADAFITITGGTICKSGSLQPRFSTTPTNGRDPVYYTTADLTGLYGANDLVTDAELSGYSFDGVTTDSQCRLHLYLPEDPAQATFNGASYTGSITPNGPNELTAQGLSLMAQVDEVTQDSATLTLTTQSDATVYYVESEIPLESAEEVRDAAGEQQHIMESGEESLTLKNLQTGKEYHYYLVAEKDSKFSNVVDVHFSTQQLSLENAKVTLSESEFTYDGQTKTPEVTVELDGEPLEYDVDYRFELVSSNDAQDTIHPGTVTVQVTGTGKYTGKAEQQPSYTIRPAVLNVSITGTLTKEYDGTTEPPEGVELVCSGQVSGDKVSVHTASFGYNSPHVQEATQLIAKDLTLEGRDAAYYTIDPPSVSVNATITKSNPNIDFGQYYGKTYDARPMELPGEDQLNLVGAGYEDLTFTWYQGEEKLDNAPVHAGRYTLEASIAEGDDTNGATSYRWLAIAPKDTSPSVELEQRSYTYDGTPKEPKVLAVRDGDVVIPPSEYLVKYTDNTNVGTAMVTIEDKPGGDYIVNTVESFTIEKGEGQLAGLIIISSSSPTAIPSPYPSPPAQAASRPTLAVRRMFPARRRPNSTWKASCWAPPRMPAKGRRSPLRWTPPRRPSLPAALTEIPTLCRCSGAATAT